MHAYNHAQRPRQLFVDAHVYTLGARVARVVQRRRAYICKTVVDARIHVGDTIMRSGIKFFENIWLSFIGRNFTAVKTKFSNDAHILKCIAL